MRSTAAVVIVSLSILAGGASGSASAQCDRTPGVVGGFTNCLVLGQPAQLVGPKPWPDAKSKPKPCIVGFFDAPC
jgi:hypothetical protein